MHVGPTKGGLTAVSYKRGATGMGSVKVADNARNVPALPMMLHRNLVCSRNE